MDGSGGGTRLNAVGVTQRNDVIVLHHHLLPTVALMSHPRRCKQPSHAHRCQGSNIQTVARLVCYIITSQMRSICALPWSVNLHSSACGPELVPRGQGDERDSVVERRKS